MFIKPSGNSVTQTGVSPAAQASGMVRPQQLSPTGNPMTVDTQYEMDNPQQSPGINFFDPNNPAYAAMRGPDPAYMNPSPGHSMQQLPGGGVDFGQGPSGQNVSTRVRPGGTMPEYNPSVGVKAPVTDQWFKDRAPQQAQVSPGERYDSAQAARDQAAFLASKMAEAKTPDEKVEYEAVKSFLDEGQPPEIANAIMVGLDPNSTKEEKMKAVALLRSRGVSYNDIISRARPVAEGVGVVPMNSPNRQFVREPKY